MKGVWALLRVGVGIVMTTAIGCTSQEHLYSQGRCLTCINNPITGQPVNYEPEQQPTMERDHAASANQVQEAAATGAMRGRFELQSPHDVDTTYARLRGEFDFRSPSDFNSNRASDQWAMMDEAWHFEAIPGAFYELSDYTRQTLHGTAHRLVVKAQVKREGDGSWIIIEYGPVASSHYEAEAMGAALQSRVESALR